MWIANGKERQLGEPAGKNRDSDMLNGELINSLGHLIGEMRSGSRHDIELLCVETGLARFDVCGAVQLGDILDFSFIIGDDGIKRQVDDFFLD
ncbi:hypothetical protein PP410_gp41 [Vibrio phage NF]|uniref:Uncharacterized protein n=1 Tax=Vibrio phage NF TaxID=2686202 RepID=A0A6B9J3U2_9CAUD|nr:hypothetical protein PP410_gp41 [Vibrio phage NF]QGZ13258.1 hypothetical protein [Vibrio phage NF]